MNNNSKTTDTKPAITVADIEALRAALGAEADLQGVTIDTAPQAAPSSTVMCPAHPWDTK
jgi:hypothetical protein